MRRSLASITVVGAVGIGAAIAFSGGSASATASKASRLDDGKALLPQAAITEADATSSTTRARWCSTSTSAAMTSRSTPPTATSSGRPRTTEPGTVR